jgi:hypothetical protein
VNEIPPPPRLPSGCDLDETKRSLVPWFSFACLVIALVFACDYLSSP